MFQLSNISNKGFIPDSCDSTCASEFSYLDEFYNNYQNDKYSNFDKFRKKIQSHKVVVDDIIYYIDQLNQSQIQKIYSITSVLSHLYVWGGEYKNTNIPACLAVPWYLSSLELGLPPIITHAAIDLYNWRLIDSEKPFSLENIEPLHFFNIDPLVKESEKWFYLPMIAIEGECGCILNKMEEIYGMIENPETLHLPAIQKNMEFIRDKMKRQYEILQNTEKCDPEHFYHLIRPYLEGSQKDFFKGWYLEGIELYVSYKGGSAAQSSLIQAEDIFLNIKHEGDNFLNKMREYMPKEHRQYLIYQDTRPGLQNLKKLLTAGEFELIEDLRVECINWMNKFRRFHYGLVQKYVGRFNNMIGTGGTNIKQNLKDYITNTKQAVVVAEEFNPYDYLHYLKINTGAWCFWILYLIISYHLFKNYSGENYYIEDIY